MESESAMHASVVEPKRKRGKPRKNDKAGKPAAAKRISSLKKKALSPSKKHQLQPLERGRKAPPLDKDLKMGEEEDDDVECIPDAKRKKAVDAQKPNEEIPTHSEQVIGRKPPQDDERIRQMQEIIEACSPSSKYRYLVGPTFRFRRI